MMISITEPKVTTETGFGKARGAVLDTRETKEVESYLSKISQAKDAYKNITALLYFASAAYNCLQAYSELDSTLVKNCFGNIKLLLQYNADIYAPIEDLSDTVLHSILQQYRSRSLLWLFLSKRFYEDARFTTAKDAFKFAPSDLLRIETDSLQVVQKVYSELKPACERYQKAQAEVKEAKDSKTRFLLHKEMGDLLYEQVVSKEKPPYDVQYLDDVIEHYLSAMEEFSRIDHQAIVNQNRQDFFQLKSFYTDTVKTRLAAFESTYKIKIPKLELIDT